MSTQLPLRDYQRAALDAVYADWDTGIQRAAVVAPTGAGKTVMFAHMISEELSTTDYAESRTLVLVHRDELADQAMSKIRQVAPGLLVGKVKAGSNEVDSDVVVASVQTLARTKRLEQLADPSLDPIGLVIVDECHHAVAPTWKRVLEELGAFDPESGVKCAGFSATLARGDEVGLGSVWEKISYAISITRLMRRGFLVEPRGFQVRVEDLDLAGVKRSGGDYQLGALGDALHESHMAETVARAYVEHAADRPGVAFTPTVDTAHEVADALSSAGIPAAVISGETPTEERRLIYKRYAAGDVQVLSNCMVLTEGFDAPWASCAVIARPTQSAPLYTQMVGRVLRPWKGKKDALVLDVVGVSGRFKLATLIDLAPGKVLELKEGESLAEAVEAAELAELETEREREVYARELGLTVRQVDLFAQSKNVWLRTEAGVWFIPTREGEVFLWPSAEPGTFDVCHAPEVLMESGRRTPAPWLRLHTGLQLELAMSWAQTEAEEFDASVATRTSSWRVSGGKASEGQQKFLRSFPHLLEGRDPAVLSKAEASDMISIGLSSRKFDRHYRKVIG